MRKTSYAKVLAAAMISIMGCTQLEKEKQIEVKRYTKEEFLENSGVNLPWINYGWDFGINPWNNLHTGLSANKERLYEDFRFMNGQKISICRIFLFCDFRAGLVRDANGDIQGLERETYEDMHCLINCAKENKVRLIPVLIDYKVADGKGINCKERTIGEHPEIIQDPRLRKQLIDRALRPFIKTFGECPEVYAWDILNEPQFCKAVKKEDLVEYIKECAKMIREEAPRAKITIGNYGDRNTFDNSCGLEDITQVHYYDNIFCPQDPKFPQKNRDAVLIGEMSPMNLSDKINRATTRGYKGILFWSLNSHEGYDFRKQAEAFKKYATRIESERVASRR